MNIGLVLSGGMAKGAYQIGALRAIEEFIPRQEIKYLSCSSVGVLNGYAFMTGKLARAEALWCGLCDNHARLFIGQILKSSLLQSSITSIYSKEDCISVPFYCSLLNFSKKKLIYKNLRKAEAEEIPHFLRASVAMPFYNRAVRIGKEAYFDGAMIDNIPVFPLVRHKLDYVICVYFDETRYRFESDVFDKRIIKITFPTQGMIEQSVVFRPEAIRSMIKTGYERTGFLLSSILRKGYDQTEQILAAISYADERYKNRSLRITGDLLVSNLNRVTKRLTKREIL